MGDITERLLADAEHHKKVAGDCDCRPEDTVNWEHAVNCLEAAAEIVYLRSALEVIAGSAKDKLQAIHARQALPNIGPRT